MLQALRRLQPGFQSPFHRGKGCYYGDESDYSMYDTFSPLFIGAKVAT